MIIAQITDCHITAAKSAIGGYIDTAAYLRRAVEHLDRLDPAPDVVLATGDLVDEGTVEEYERLRDIVVPLRAPLYLIPGNHDNRENLTTVFHDHAYLPPAGDFIQYVVEDYPVRLIALDTLIDGQATGDMCGERLSWLDERLAEAPERPTLLFMHHPPFLTGMRKMDQSGLTDSKPLSDVVSRHDHVELIISGHLHRPIVRRFAGTVASVCPSTAHQLALDLGAVEKLSVTKEPPAVGLHLWQQDESSLVSHISYIGDYPERLIYDGENWVADGKERAAAD
jgi:3',5'-cyclic AMP phosphodiesterase CpdA